MARGYGVSPIKLYYRIGEAAEMVGVEPHVLRYWESEFPTIRPQKSRSGQRVYSRRDVEKLLRIKELLYEQRFTIAGARQRLRTPAAAECPDPISRNSNASAVDAGSVGRGRQPPECEAEAPPLVARRAVGDAVTRHEEESRIARQVAAEKLRANLLSMRAEVVKLLEAMQESEP